MLKSQLEYIPSNLLKPKRFAKNFHAIYECMFCLKLVLKSVSVISINDPQPENLPWPTGALRMLADTLNKKKEEEEEEAREREREEPFLLK